ncbi:MAG TPA: ClpXP protease specificity-enhancing factor [Steroidobacteraceae bacterium]|nr:ClpXP protease specificity-enhancing factor [Steroidobacteraceae bacterium]
MISRRPYLLRAMHEWISDSGHTPHLVVDAGVAGVDVPRQFVKDGKIVLNVSWSATAQLKLGNDEITFSGRFGGASMMVFVPVNAVLAIYARETGQGMIFSDDEPAPPAAEPPKEPPKGPRPVGGGGRAKLKVVK